MSQNDPIGIREGNQWNVVIRRGAGPVSLFLTFYQGLNRWAELFLKLNMGDLNEKLLGNYTFGYNRTKVTKFLREDMCFYPHLKRNFKYLTESKMFQTRFLKTTQTHFRPSE
jgi:hypothetical protein